MACVLCQRFLVFMVSLSMLSCVSSGRRTNPQASSLTSSEAAKQQLESSFRAKQFSSVIEQAQSFQKKYPSHEFVLDSMNYEGLAFMSLHKYGPATNKFKQTVQKARKEHSQFLSYYQINYVHSLIETSRLTEVDQELSLLSESLLDRENRYKLAILRLRFADLKKLDAELTEFERLARFRSVGGLFKEFPDFLRQDALTEQMWSVRAQQLWEPLINQVELDENYIKDFKDFPVERKLVSLWLSSARKKQEADRARVYSDNRFAGDSLILNNASIVAGVPVSAAATTPLVLNESVMPSTSGKSRTIGLLLPEDSRRDIVTKPFMEGLSLSFPNSKIVLLDQSKHDGELLENAKKLVEEHGVMAIVGPFGSKGLESLIDYTLSVGVPLFPLTQTLPKLSPNVFQFYISPAQQVGALLTYAMGEMGWRRFAICAPRSRFGSEYSDQFLLEVERRGGVVTEFETYDPGDVDYRGMIDRMVGLNRSDYRQDELNALAQTRRELKISKRTAATEKYFALPPIVNFDAIFIPDDAKKVTQIYPTFFYRDVNRLPLLGLNLLNSPSLVARGGDLVEGVVFPDFFDPSIEEEGVKNFVEAFEKKFVRKPGAFEVLGYDLGLLFEQLSGGASESGIGVSQDRSDWSDELHSTKELQVTGSTLKYQDSSLNRSLRLFEVRGGRIQVL